MVSITEIIKTICEKIINLNSNYVSKTTFQTVCNAKALTVADNDASKDTGDNFYLIGNVIRGQLNNSSVSLTVGNIANTEVSHPYIAVNFDTTTSPFVKKIIGNSFISGGYGGICALNISDSEIKYADVLERADGSIYYDVVNYSVKATATHAAISGRLSSYYYAPIEINTNYFDYKE